MSTKTAIRWGEICSAISLPPSVVAEASHFATRYYEGCEAIDFSGDDVETLDVPGWIGDVDSLVPVEDLAAMGYRWGGKLHGNELIATVGVDQHIDNAFGPVLCIVLHNDDLTFRSGKVSHKPKAGDCFVFNDRVNHGVKEAKGASVFVALTLPLVDIGR